MPERPVSFEASKRWLGRALERIPTGSQTFSKSYLQFPVGYAPLFLERGKAGRVWDIDGNEFVDLVAGLLPITLGYCDPDIDTAIKAQLEKGISFSLSTKLELDLAEQLAKVVPCAEMSRFGKSGSDATAAVVRLARAATRRDRIVMCGYHGWHDWYVGSTVRALGVPEAVRNLTHRIPYGDVETFHALLNQFPGEIAGIIMEPMNSAEPPMGYLAEMREVAHAHGALFAFDEIITGFRYALGGAQEFFGVTPDIAAFGKGMGNGMPISAVVGKADVMHLLDEVFFSGTFGGETLSLAAAIAVIDKMQREPVIEHLFSFGRRLNDAVASLLQQHGLTEIISLRGQPCWTILAINDHAHATKEEIKTFIVTRLACNGVLSNGTHNICYAHSDRDLNDCVTAYRCLLAELEDHLRAGQGRLRAAIGCDPVRPVFSVRTHSR
jgi:glutamate-1-semialdehyde 2,1-aminomutase/spore coat polysaccharide biosynthesis protein SpsF